LAVCPTNGVILSALLRLKLLSTYNNAEARISNFRTFVHAQHFVEDTMATTGTAGTAGTAGAASTASTTSGQAAKEEIKGYTFFNPRLRDASYATGDIYSKEVVATAQLDWQIPK